MYLLHFTFMVLLSINGCSSQSDSAKKTDNLYQYWIHSHEDDGEDYKAYRPSNFDFPVSRGRDGFEIKADGRFVWNRIAPTDGNEKVNGTWVWEDEAQQTMLATFEETDQTTRLRLKVISVTKELLKVQIAWVHD